MLDLAGLTDVEQAILRHAVQDGGPAILKYISDSRDAVGRYLTEGGNLLPAHDWRAVWRCIVQLIEREPDLVAGPVPTQAVLDMRERARQDQADALLSEAYTTFQDADWAGALELIDRAELAAPLYNPDGQTYEHLRRFVCDAQKRGHVAFRLARTGR